QDDGQRNHGFDEKLPSPGGERQPVRERQSDDEQHTGDDRGKPHAEPNRSPVHAQRAASAFMRTGPNPASARSLTTSGCFRNVRNARAASLFRDDRTTMPACSIGG